MMIHSISLKLKGKQWIKSSINYSLDELRSLMLDARITIVDGVMTSFDRKTKSVTVVDHRGKKLIMNYDILVLSVGLVDNTLKELTRERPRDTKESKENRRLDGGRLGLTKTSRQ